MAITLPMSIYGAARRVWAWFIQIPEDIDAKGIVIRVLNHKYYLHPYSIRFLDPYIEVEYNLAWRHRRMQLISYTCIFMCAIGTMTFYLTSEYVDIEGGHIRAHEFGLEQYVVNHIFVGVLLVATCGTFVAIRVPRITYVLNWSYVTTVVMLVWSFLFNVFVVKSMKSMISSYSSETDPYQHRVQWYLLRFLVASNVLSRAIQLSVFVMNSLICLIVGSILSFIECTFVCMACGIITLYTCFDLIHMDWPTRDEHYAIFQPLPSPSNRTMPLTPLPEPMLYGTILYSITSYIPFESSVFDTTYYMEMQMEYIVFYWLIFTGCLVMMQRSRDLLQRENFILKRVRSDKDARRVDDGGIAIEVMMKENEHDSDEGVLEKNRDAWKLSPSKTHHTRSITTVEDDAPDMTRLGESWGQLQVPTQTGNGVDPMHSSGSGEKSTTDKSLVFLNQIKSEILSSGIVQSSGERYTRSE